MKPHTPVALGILAMAALTWCTSSQPTQYERGTLTRPPPPTLRPGHGAPTYDPQVQPLPPQPQPKSMRHLPETPETRRTDGIWAAETPPSVFPTMPFLYGIALPYPEVEEKIDRSMTDFCAYSMMARSNDPGMERDAWRKWDKSVRTCLAAKLYLHCAQRMTERYNAHVELGIAMDKGHERMVRLTVDKAASFERRMCSSPMPGQAVAYMDEVRRRFDVEHDRQMAELRAR